MSEIQTMQVGPVEVRKTAEGWQYLSEGVGNDPDHWCDATSVLGPFGGSGVNTLLDELLAARQQTEQKAERVCKNCRYWGASQDGCCDFIDTIQGEQVANTTGCQIIVRVNDDWGLNVALQTAPNFTCPNFSK
ncbi:hypothetical protein [Pseudomonas aeruginosa]|uniref:hypothetical protein n=1 Tax=Pseudomonas aeruginosa TaxID=287 RepID=UPI0034E08760